MKVSEVIDQLAVGDTVWVKGKIREIDQTNAPICISFKGKNNWFYKPQEISLIEPTKKVEIPIFVAEWIEFCKEQEFSLYSAMSDKRLIDGTFILSNPYQSFRSWLLDDNYHQEIFARAWLDGFTVEPKQWVVKFKQQNEQFYFMGWTNSYSTLPAGYKDKEADNVMKFKDKSKAEAVATLVEGSVEVAE